MNYIIKHVFYLFIASIFCCCKTNTSDLIQLSESEIMKMIADDNFDLSKAVYRNNTNKVLSFEEQKSYPKSKTGKDFYADSDFNIKEIRFRDSVTYKDKLIYLSIEYSLRKPENILKATVVDCTNLKIPLEEIFETDQEVRNSGINIKMVDSINRITVINILEKCGIPKKEDVGFKAVSGVFLTIQHAPNEIRAYYYPQFYVTAQQNNISMASLAVMQDRLLAYNGFDQVYGTQRAGIGNFPIEDPENVNERRKKVGLSPL